VSSRVGGPDRTGGGRTRAYGDEGSARDESAAPVLVADIATELAVLAGVAVVLMAISARARRRTLTHGG